MDVREKLVELLEPHMSGLACEYESGSCELTSCRSCNAKNIADHLIANGVTVQEWISVDDRLPTQEDAPTEYVFTAYKNQNCYDVEIALWDTVIAYPDLYDYWMALPMPQPPKGE